MAAPPAPGPLSLEQLLEAIDRLAPAQRRELERRLTWRRVEDGNEESGEATSVRAAKVRLPAAAERRLKRLIARSERGLLTPEELAEYQALAQEVQRLDAARAEALAELGRRGVTSAPSAKGGISGKGGRDGA
jgi:hypothetical protein